MSNCIPPEDVEPIDPNEGGPEAPGGGGNPDGNGPENPPNEEVTDSNANYSVDAEDPFQKPNGDPVPYEIWELPAEGVTKPFSFQPTQTKVLDGVTQGIIIDGYRERDKRYAPYETSGTLKYMPYGNNRAPSNLPTIPEKVTSVYQGKTYRTTATKVLQSPIVDGYHMIPYSQNNAKGFILSFWDASNMSVQHAIRVEIPYFELELERSAAFPGKTRIGPGLAGPVGTNLTNGTASFSDYRLAADPYNTIAQNDIGIISGGTKAADKFAQATPDDEYSFGDRSTTISWSGGSRLFGAYVSATVPQDGKEYALGCFTRFYTDSIRFEPSLHPATVVLPNPVTSATEINMTVTPWDSARYARFLYNSRQNLARNTTMAGHAMAVDPAGTKSYSDKQAKLVGVAGLRSLAETNFERPCLSEDGLKMTIKYANNFLNQASYGTTVGTFSPESLMEFRRSSLNDEFEVYGSVVDPVYFEAGFVNWETYEYNKPTGTNWALGRSRPFYHNNQLHVLNYGYNTYMPNRETGSLQLWIPNVEASSYSRAIGMATSTEYSITIPNMDLVVPLEVDTWTPTSVRLSCRLAGKQGVTLVVDFVAGTYSEIDTVATFPPRLAHLKNNEYYKFQSFGRKLPGLSEYRGVPYARQYPIVYNGFTIIGVPDTPLVPNVSYRDDIQSLTQTLSGAYDNQQHRRALLGVGEICALDASGNEVWRLEPSDARSWAAFNEETRTVTRSLQFANHGDQTNSADYLTIPELAQKDPVYFEYMGFQGTETFRDYTKVGLNRVRFGQEMVLAGTKLYISHGSLPTNIDVPPVGQGRQYRGDETYSHCTPRGASKVHAPGYVILDLTTIPELNP